MTITRRKFLQSAGLGGSLLLLNCARGSRKKTGTSGASFMQQWRQPPRESSQAAFWFWNDDLSEAELSRQMQDFVDHGVYGFVIHPRVGLPRNIGWMSDRMIHFMRYAIEEAKKMGRHKTKKAAVEEALEEYIMHRKQLKIIDLFHTIDIDPEYDYKKQRMKM